MSSDQTPHSSSAMFDGGAADGDGHLEGEPADGVAVPLVMPCTRAPSIHSSTLVDVRRAATWCHVSSLIALDAELSVRPSRRSLITPVANSRSDRATAVRVPDIPRTRAPGLLTHEPGDGVDVANGRQRAVQPCAGRVRELRRAAVRNRRVDAVEGAVRRVLDVEEVGAAGRVDGLRAGFLDDDVERVRGRLAGVVRDGVGDGERAELGRRPAENARGVALNVSPSGSPVAV